VNPPTEPQCDVLSCAPDILWVRDADQVLAIDPETDQAWSLRGIEAALWDWLVMGYPYARLVHLVSLALGVPQDVAEQETLGHLSRWESQGLLHAKGQPSP